MGPTWTHQRQAEYFMSISHHLAIRHHTTRPSPSSSPPLPIPQRLHHLPRHLSAVARAQVRFNVARAADRSGGEWCRSWNAVFPCTCCCPRTLPANHLPVEGLTAPLTFSKQARGQVSAHSLHMTTPVLCPYPLGCHTATTLHPVSCSLPSCLLLNTMYATCAAPSPPPPLPQVSKHSSALTTFPPSTSTTRPVYPGRPTKPNCTSLEPRPTSNMASTRTPPAICHPPTTAPAAAWGLHMLWGKASGCASPASF